MMKKHINNFIAILFERPFLVAGGWFAVFLVFFLGLASVGFVPTTLTGDENNAPTVLAAATEQYALGAVGPGRVAPTSTEIEPRRIIIDAIDVDFSIENPESRDVAVLDEALRSGVVHYPGSGNLNDTSNMFLFGHSSRLPVVRNPAYKAFNDIEKLEEGDIIRVRSATEEYLYTVTTVSLVDASEAWVELSNREKKLTLSTCDNFGSKQDRFVVEATFLDSYQII